MKHWRVDYTIKYIDGREEELDVTLEANSIVAAADLAVKNIEDPQTNNPEISDIVIWNVGIMENDVFAEEGDEGDQ